MSTTKKVLPPSFHLVCLVTLAVLLWAYWTGWVSLVETWQSDPDYNHGFLVIPISAWLLWQRRDRLASMEFHPSWWGIAFLVAAGIVRGFGAEFFIAQFEVWSIPLWIAGVVLLFGGWPLLKWSGGAIAFLWFMTPLPESMIDFVSLPLQKISAVVSTWTLHLFAQPAVRSGTTISLGEQVLEVERACSGLRICYGIMALAVAYVVLMRPKLLRGIILLATAIPVAILANSARVTVTGLLFLVVSGEKAHQYAHDFAGLLMLPLAVGLLWLVHMTMDKFIGAFERSSRSGSLLVLKSGLAFVVLATGLVLWQRTQADAAIGTLLKIAERHETDGQKFQDENKVEEAAREWKEAARFLDDYCRVRPEDAPAAKRMAVAAERIAFRPSGLVRAARCYQRAWALQPDDSELGFKQTRLALAGEEFAMALAGADKLLLQTPADSAEHLAAFQLKVQGQIQDANRANPATTWTQVAETLKYGISNKLDAVNSCYQLAVVYRQHPIDSIEEEQREAAAEQVFDELLTQRADDPRAWLARSTFHQTFPAPVPVSPTPETNPTENDTAVVGVPVQSPDADLDHAIELAARNLNSETHAIWLVAGSRALARKEYKEAREYFRNAAQADPKHFLAYLQLARMETEFDADGNPVEEITPEQRQAAIEILQQALSHEELKNEVLLRVELLRQQLQSPDATQVAEANQGILDLKTEFQKYPAEIGVPFQLELAVLESQILADAGDFVKASRLLESILNSKDVVGMQGGSGLLSRAWLTLGSYYEQQGLSDKASASFQQGTTLEPTSIPTAMYQAFTAERENKTSAAADLFEDVAARLGNRPEPWMDLARNELRQQLAKAASQQDFSRLTKALEEARNLGAPDVDITVLDSDIAAAKGDNEQALAILEESAPRNLKSSEIWRRLAVLRQVSGNASGATDALTHYRSTVDDALQAVLLEAELLVRANDWDNAQRVLTEALQTTADPEKQRQLHEQLVQLQLLNDHPEAAQQVLEEYAKQHPFDIKTQVQLGNLYWARQNLDLMEQAEQKLRKLEGEGGAFWKDLRARRLIEMASRTQDEGERSTLLAEAKTLIEVLPVVNRPQTQVLLGRIALQERRFPDAARHFEAAWIQGERTVVSATELIFALQSAGDAAKVESYLEQMQNFLRVSPQLFDLALGAKSQVSFADLDTSAEIAQSWVQSIADADSYVRLARTLQLNEVQTEPQRTQHLEQIETAYRKAVELDPKNPQSWGEFLRFVYRDRNDAYRAIAELNAYTQSPVASELDRSFVTSQLLTELGLQQPAARHWNTTIELAKQQDGMPTLERVLTLAASFFVGVDSSRAMDLARQAVALDPANVANLRLLAALLSDANTESSLREASSLLDSLEKAGAQPENSQPVDADKRIIASVLYRRAVLLPSEYNVADDLRRAAQLLNSLNRSTEVDAVQLALIVAEQGDKQAALVALSEQARRSDASVPTIFAFAKFWQDNFAETDVLQDRLQQALQMLERTPGREIVALDLRLRPDSLDSQQIDDIVQEFLKTVVSTQTSVPDQNALLQQTFAMLARRQQRDLSLRILSDDLAPLTDVQKLNALVVVTIVEPGSAEFEASLSGLLDSQLPTVNNADLDRSAADYYFMRANWVKAESYYRKCLQRDAKDVAATNNLALVVVELRGDFAEADRLIQQGLSIMANNKSPAGSNSFLLDTQSQLLSAAGKTDQALEILTPLSQSATADASVFLHLAECFHKLNRIKEFQQAFGTAQQLGIGTSVLPPMDKLIYENLVAANGKQAKR